MKVFRCKVYEIELGVETDDGYLVSVSKSALDSRASVMSMEGRQSDPIKYRTDEVEECTLSNEGKFAYATACKQRKTDCVWSNAIGWFVSTADDDGSGKTPPITVHVRMSENMLERAVEHLNGRDEDLAEVFRTYLKKLRK